MRQNSSVNTKNPPSFTLVHPQSIMGNMLSRHRFLKYVEQLISRALQHAGALFPKFKPIRGQSLSLLHLPAELREEIYSHLLLPQIVYRTSPTTNPRVSTRRSVCIYTNPTGTFANAGTVHSLNQWQNGTSRTLDNNVGAFYVDTCVYLPCAFPGNVLLVCKQLREECLAYYTRRLNSGSHATIADPEPIEQTASYKLAGAEGAVLCEMTERLHDDDCVRVTLEFFKQMHNLQESYMLGRQCLSPRFMALTSTFNRLKKIKFMVWVGHARPLNFRDTGNMVEDLSPRMAIDSLLKHFPLVEEVNIDLLIHFGDFIHWGGQSPLWLKIKDWFETSISLTPKARLRKMEKRLLMVMRNSNPRTKIMLRQCESLQVLVERDTFRVSHLYCEWSEQGLTLIVRIS
jgi:hypothetical protein